MLKISDINIIYNQSLIKIIKIIKLLLLMMPQLMEPIIS